MAAREAMSDGGAAKLSANGLAGRMIARITTRRMSSIFCVSRFTWRSDASFAAETPLYGGGRSLFRSLPLDFLACCPWGALAFVLLDTFFWRCWRSCARFMSRAAWLMRMWCRGRSLDGLSQRSKRTRSTWAVKCEPLAPFHSATCDGEILEKGPTWAVSKEVLRD